MGLGSKAAEFVKRFFAGLGGSAIPLAFAVGCQYMTKSTWPTQTNQLLEIGLYSAGLGLASAAVTSTSSNAFNRGLMFGSIAQITSALGGIGEGKSWDKAAENANVIQAALVAIPGAVSLKYRELSSWASQTGNEISSRISNAWNALWKNDVK